MRRLGSEKCFVTSQNHGFAVDSDSSLPDDWETAVCQYERRHQRRHTPPHAAFLLGAVPPRSVEWPRDTEFLFDEFIASLYVKKYQKVLLLGSGALKIGEAGRV